MRSKTVFCLVTLVGLFCLVPAGTISDNKVLASAFKAHLADALVGYLAQGGHGLQGPWFVKIPASANAHAQQRPLNRYGHLRTCFHHYTIRVALHLRKHPRLRTLLRLFKPI